MRGPEKDRVTHGRSQYRQTCAKPCSPGALYRYEDEQRVENACNRHARRIENGKQQDTGGPPRNKSVGQMSQQCFNLTRALEHLPDPTAPNVLGIPV